MLCVSYFVMLVKHPIHGHEVPSTHPDVDSGGRRGGRGPQATQDTSGTVPSPIARPIASPAHHTARPTGSAESNLGLGVEVRGPCWWQNIIIIYIATFVAYNTLCMDV